MPNKPPADIQLTKLQTKVLKHVRANPGCAVIPVATTLGHRPYWVIQALEALERFRWIRREPGAGASAYDHRWFAREDLNA